MKRRLERAGQRSISALVDVTNYVMLELGRPLHVYDLDKLKGGIDVRFGRGGEYVTLLNGRPSTSTRTCLRSPTRADRSGSPASWAAKARKRISTHDTCSSSPRFSSPPQSPGARGATTSRAMPRIASSAASISRTRSRGSNARRTHPRDLRRQAGTDRRHRAKLPERKPVRMRVARAHKVLGIAVPADRDCRHLPAAWVRIHARSAGHEEAFVVTPPSYRFDLEIEEDLIEEVARMHGYDRIPAHPPLAPAMMLPER